MPAEILQSARRALSAARRGVADLRDTRDAERRMIGLRNVVVWGRSAAHVLENLRGSVAGFDQWFEPYRDDATMQYLIDLRNEVLKQGELPVEHRVHVAELDAAVLRRNLPPAPVGAKSFFIGDEFGGNGWVIELPTGETEKFYIELPRVPGLLVHNTIRLVDVPAAFQDMPVQDVCERFVRFLGGMVTDAERHFRK